MQIGSRHMMGCALVALFGLAFSAACGSDETTTGSTTSSSAGPTGSTGSGDATSSTSSTGGEGGAGEGGAGGAGGQGGGSAEAKKASAKVEPKSGSMAKGMVTFTQVGSEVTLQIDVTDVTPAGPHGFHIHMNGDCTHQAGDSAGGHWDPYKKQHGKFGEGEFHLGDIGNVMIGNDGKGSLTLKTDLWAVDDQSEKDVVGHAVILHMGEDNLKPDANPGTRIGCGVIVLDK